MFAQTIKVDVTFCILAASNQQTATSKKEEERQLADLEPLQQTIDAQLEQLMREYGTRILRLVYLFVKDRALAEDITQDVFVKVYRHLDSFRGESDIHTWMYRIAVNECKGYLRSWSFRHIFPGQLPEKTDERTVEQTVMRRVEQENIAHLVLRLTRGHREVIALHYYSDLSVAQIADILKMKEGAVRTKLHRARLQLKALIEEEEGLEWT